MGMAVLRQFTNGENPRMNWVVVSIFLLELGDLPQYNSLEVG